MPSFKLSLGLRPQSLDDFVGQGILTDRNSLFRKGIDKGKLYSSIFWGPPGCGKTSIAMAACTMLGQPFGYMDCTEANTELIRSSVQEYSVLIFDEIQYLTKKQQQLLLQVIEQQGTSIIGTTTEYPKGQLHAGVLDRCNVYKLQQLNKEQMFEKASAICTHYKISFEIEALKAICEISDSLRGVYNRIEMLVTAGCGIDQTSISQLPEIKFGTNSKEGLASALQKSIRGSDPDASVYYLAQLLKLGELEYVARRLRIIASEDIGLADSNASTVVASCCKAALQTGLPEAGIPMAHAVLHLALAPKSNSATVALNNAMEAREAPAPNVIAFGHAEGYIYPHDYPGNYYPFDYLPKDLQGCQFYHAGDNKWEQAAQQYLQGRKAYCKEHGIGDAK